MAAIKSEGPGTKFLHIQGGGVFHIPLWTKNGPLGTLDSKEVDKIPVLKELFKKYNLDDFNFAWFDVRRYYRRSKEDSKAIEDELVRILSTRELSEPQIAKIITEYQDNNYIQIKEGIKPYREVIMTLSDYFDLINAISWIIHPSNKAKGFDDPYDIESLD